MQNRALLLAALGFSAGVVGCGSDVIRATGGDAAVDTPPSMDTVPPDAPPPPPPPPDVTPVDVAPVDVAPDVPRVPRCGDRFLDPGESCDDGNNTSGDGCSAMCRFEARCGDMRVDMGEACDDGNNASGDGCRSDCLSNERCGNMIVDTAAGEVCDSTPGCGMDCRTVASCGNGRMDMGEQCDDGNRVRWDGCGPDCLREQAVVVTSLQIAQDTGMIGCDFSGDRVPDNAFGRALGMAGGLLNSFISSNFSNGQTLLQLGFLNLTDVTGQNVPDARVGWLIGVDGDAERTNNTQPGNPQFVSTQSLNAMTQLPQASFQSRITMGRLAGGPEDVRLNLAAGPAGMLNFRVLRGRLSGTVVAEPTRVTALRDGVLCGAIPAADLSELPNPAGLLPGGGGGGGGGDRGTFLELLVGGQRIILFQIGPQQPDIDLDGDGLERIETMPGPAGSAPRITACIDGDGTRIPGRMCASDPRIADGFTAAFQLQGTHIALRGARMP
jgi:cysteine-rich repeat protein